MSAERTGFFKLADDKLYYDEKRKRFVNTSDSPGFAHRSYYQGHFKHVSVFKLRLLRTILIFKSFYSNALISTDRRRKNSAWNLSTVSNWSVRWTLRQSWKWRDCKDRWVRCLTCTSTLCLMTTWELTQWTALEFYVHGPGRIVLRSSTSSTPICFKLRSMDSTSPFSSSTTWLKRSLRQGRTTWQLISCMSFASLLRLQPSDSIDWTQKTTSESRIIE